MNQSPWTCGTCPGPLRCPIAEAEECLMELCRDYIRQEISDIVWMLSMGDDGLDKPAQYEMSILLSKLRRVLMNDSPAELSSVFRQIRFAVLQNEDE